MTLTTPVRVGSRTAPSRVIFGPHETNLGDDRRLSGRHVDYYRRRAQGGAGLIVTETASVEPSDWPYERAPLAADCGPGWAALAKGCAPEGTVVLAGLGHTGLEGSSAYSQHVLWGPSRVADVVTREPPAEMEQEQIDAVVAGFASAARIAMSAGLAGVEVDVGTRSLLRQFLSPLTNVRADGYGLERSRLTEEVLGAVRDAAGPDAVVAMRLSADERAPWAGITPEQAETIASQLAALVDLITIVQGGPFSATSYRPDGHTPPGFNWDLCAGIRTAVAGMSPVVLQGSVVSVEQAQAALDAGVADLVEMTRAQIADPDLVVKARRGAAERIRPCLLCNQACLVRDPRNPIVTCVGEPSSGYETVEPAPSSEAAPMDRGTRVTVIGGGPAGLECARVLALQGAAVRVVEASSELGGAARDAAAMPGRERVRLLGDWLEAECRRLGVEVVTGRRWELEDVAEAEAEGWMVVLAAGSRLGTRPWPVVDALDVCREGPDRLLRGPVVVDDPVGGPVGVGIAEWLVADGRAVTLVSPDPVAGTLLAWTGDLADANARLQRAGVRRALRSRIRSVSDGRVELEGVWTGERSTLEANVVVDAGHRLPDDRLASARPDLPAAGDCVAPRTILEAVLEGRRTARELLGRQATGRTPSSDLANR